MTRFGLDSTGEVPAWAHHAAGSTVALRYLSRSTPKVITQGEHARYKQAGIDLVLVFEDAADNALRGYEQGKADAQFALAQATDRLGRPALPPCIRFAVDFDTAGNPGRTDAYFDGVAAVLPRSNCGPYGSDEMLAHAASRGFLTLWQTYAWSGGRFFSSPHNTVYQYSNDHTIGGVGVDFNHIYGHDFGQWDRKAAAPVEEAHYKRFPLGPFAWKSRKLYERAAVTEYDRLRRHPLLHRPRLHVLRGELQDLADRVAFEVISEATKTGHPRNWVKYFRGWRYQQLIARAHGKRLD